MENTMRSLIDRLGRFWSGRRAGRRATTLSLRPGHPVHQVSVAGDLNGWSYFGHPLQRSANGTWTITLDLAPGTYRYRFLIDNCVWVLDPDADAVSNADGGYDSVLTVESERPAPPVTDSASLAQELYA